MSSNPFEVTKAVDFTDDQISKNFVSFVERDPYSIVDPRSAMPQFLVGGKGGGRTHLMRYFAYPLQKMRASSSPRSVEPLDAIIAEQYLGIYFRCSGLNGSRFEGKNQTEDAWTAVFSFYMDLWLCEQLLVVLEDIQKEYGPWNSTEQSDFASGTRSLLRFSAGEMSSVSEGMGTETISSLLQQIVTLRHRIDRSINNAALTQTLEVDILSSPGILLFGAVKQAVQSLPGLRGLRFTYLIDEFENLNEMQQRYINTLVREKELPTCFLIGGREWGIRTHKTLSAGEENKRGSEFQWIVLEDSYRSGSRAYLDFCKYLVSSRLRDSGIGTRNAESIESLFGTGTPDRLETDSLLEVFSGVGPKERTHLRNFKETISRASDDRALVDEVCGLVEFADSPLLEKLCILKFFKIWNRERSFDVNTAITSREYIAPLLTESTSQSAKNFLNLWKSDMIAQIYWENERRTSYYGFGQFVKMSGYLPRSLLVILKSITQWSIFFDERPFASGNPISKKAQNAGVRDASRWFLADAKPLGMDGDDCDRAIRRLGSLLRGIRQSDKPTEVSVNAFSTNMQDVDQNVIRLIEVCVNHRLLIEIPSGRTSRNHGAIHRKFRIHPMIAPIFGLSTGVRGELSLKSDELNAIFNPLVDESTYSRIVKAKLAPMNAPFPKRRTTIQTIQKIAKMDDPLAIDELDSNQEALFDLN